MPWKNAVKLTVLKKTWFEDLAKEHIANPEVGPCARFEEGQEFIITRENYLTMLDGQFCSEAWAAISHYIYTALQGGSIMHGWNKEDGTMITCCNDGVRPVIFKIERLESELT